MSGICCTFSYFGRTQLSYNLHFAIAIAIADEAMAFLGLPLLLSSICPVLQFLWFFMGRLHTMPKYRIFSAHRISLLVQKYYFMSIKLCYLFLSLFLSVFNGLTTKKDPSKNGQIQGLNWKLVKKEPLSKGKLSKTFRKSEKL